MPEGRAEPPSSAVFERKCCRIAPTPYGFGVFATRPIAAGDAIMIERPLVLTPSWEVCRRACSVCLAESQCADGCAEWSDLCAGCGSVAFCSTACAELARREELHGHVECAGLAAWRRAVTEDDADADVADLVVQAVRILAYRHGGTRVRPFAPELGEAEAEGEQLLRVGYEAYASRLCPMRRTARSGEGIKRAVLAALRAVPAEARVKPAELYDVLSRHQCNCYGVMGRGSTSVGLASNVGALHYFNHSCVPNCTFDSVPLGAPAAGHRGALWPTRFALRALVDVAEGEELLHCYAGSADGPSARRAYLRDHFGFECECARCACDDPAEEAELSERLDAMRCRCDDCGSGLGYELRRDSWAAACAGEHEDEPAGRQLRCVHCGGEWECDEDD